MRSPPTQNLYTFAMFALLALQGAFFNPSHHTALAAMISMMASSTTAATRQDDRQEVRRHLAKKGATTTSTATSAAYETKRPFTTSTKPQIKSIGKRGRGYGKKKRSKGEMNRSNPAALHCAYFRSSAKRWP
uniref:Secreted protein n=1 Tax=Entomoneis paludosa TaxID=265537 RepID=A0A7S3DP32_9STRA|mmetsp:Transcript_2493/g.5129  ORF Transcript_2493/g.5129 Transcript_2493/m.5129 type:complete len:132 (+) Transcript_2493:155-550(+)